MYDFPFQIDITNTADPSLRAFLDANAAAAKESRQNNPNQKYGRATCQRRPCYGRRCSNANCRNKEAWRSYTQLVRSCQYLPPTHMVTLVFPFGYYGHASTSIINRFCSVLLRSLPSGSSLSKYWRYDSTASGHWPHVHMLVRTNAMLSEDIVAEAWRSVWVDSVSLGDVSSLVSSACSPIFDVIGACQYVTKHGSVLRPVLKQEWSGRLSGGDQRFFCTTKSSLMKDDFYNSEYYRYALWQLEERLRKEYPALWFGISGSTHAESDIIDAEVHEGKHSILANYIFVGFVSLSVGLDRIIVERKDTFAGGRPSGRMDRKSLLRYAIWTLAPPKSTYRGDRGREVVITNMEWRRQTQSSVKDAPSARAANATWKL